MSEHLRHGGEVFFDVSVLCADVPLLEAFSVGTLHSECPVTMNIGHVICSFCHAIWTEVKLVVAG